MERVERFEDIAGLLSAQLKKGVVTNHFFSKEDYDREIQTGLYVHPFDGGVLLLRQRTGYYVMSFYLQAGQPPEMPATELPVVTEVVWRPKDAEAAASGIARLEAAGFHACFRRRRYCRPAAEEIAPAEAAAPGAERAEEVQQFLQAHFDPRAGCIPTPDALRAMLAAGEILCAEDADGITGLLHFARSRAHTEIRHLAVREDRRGQGLAERLLGAYLQTTAYQKSLVWARQGNTPAERFYEKHQYRPDGWESVVLLADGKDML